LNELNFSLILYYTKTSRESATIIEKQIENVKNSAASALEAMHQVRAQSFAMKEAFLRSDLDGIGRILHESWLSKKEMATGISNADIEKIYETAMKAGAHGGKISGAGGGGFMFFFAGHDKKYDVIAALKNLGGDVVNYEFTQKGLDAWTTR
jgi:D-glycero-alpha-D-manno-heptose-7-phosphate kinase